MIRSIIVVEKFLFAFQTPRSDGLLYLISRCLGASTPVLFSVSETFALARYAGYYRRAKSYNQRPWVIEDFRIFANTVGKRAVENLPVFLYGCSLELVSRFTCLRECYETVLV